MARIFFMAFDEAGQSTLQKRLRASGHKLAITPPRWPAFFELLKQQDPVPDVFLVDCSRLASHAREACNYLKGLKAYKDRPFVLYNVKKEDQAKTLEKVPDAILVFSDAVEKQLAAMGLAPPPPAP